MLTLGQDRLVALDEPHDLAARMAPMNQGLARNLHASKENKNGHRAISTRGEQIIL